MNLSILFQELRIFPPSMLVAMTMLLSACASSQISTPYMESYYPQQLKVVLLDQESLAQAYEARYGRPARRLTMSAGIPSSISRVKAFYDFETHTIYCVKWDFENCGHELHHALLGRFHAEDY